jgi:large repetitive protein
MEALESRHLLSITLPAGTSVFLPINSGLSGTVNYAVTASDYSKITPVLMPQTNKSLKLNVTINGASQTMVFQLLDNLSPNTAAHIESLVQSQYYDGLQIYRNGKDSSGNPFVIQGGNDPPTGAIKTDQASIAEEFNPNLRFTSAGILAMARQSTPGTSSTEFFVTEEPARFLDYSYTIFGIQTQGSSLLSSIAAMTNQSSTQDPNGIGYLATPLTITSASIITDTQNGVLELTAPSGVTGTVTITVTASNGTSTPTTQTYTLNIQADSSSNRANPFASDIPAAPSSVTFVPPAGVSGGHYANANNSASDKTLQFLVTGVTSGDLVEVLADGVVIGHATASSDTVIVTSDGSTKLSDGLHNITAIQIARSQTVGVVESGSSTAINKTADVPSLNTSSTWALTVDSVAPQLSFTPGTSAVVGVPYSCQVAVSQDSGTAITFKLLASPTGMSIDSSTGLITWTPATGQQTATQVTVEAVDTAGNIDQLSYTINVLATNAAPVLTAANPSLGSTSEDAAITISLTSFINNGDTTSKITDVDDNAVKGGIAVVGTTGNGTWRYSLDGTTYTVLGTVSQSSALLLASNASLRYTPDGKNGETPTITYRAWDTTGGISAGRADLTQTGLVGGSGPYSTNSDTASVTVSSVNDAPVLTVIHPSMGSTPYTTAKTIAISSFVNSSTGTPVSDADNGAVIGGIALTGTTGKGTWAYSLGGTTFINVGTVSDIAALLLPGTASLRYTPGASDTEMATVTYRAWDTTSGQGGAPANTTTNDGTTAFSAASDIASLAVVSPNTAPVLTAASPSLGNTTPTTAITVKLTAFINNGSATTKITDADTGAVLGGIALTGTTGKGTWAYSLDGTTYTAVGTVAGNSALLLPGTASLRYTPDGTDFETATITYRAWDTFTGSSGALVDATTNGGATAFSTATDTAALTVVAGSISGYVYFDSNNDCVKNGSESGISGMTVRLYTQNSGGSWTEVSAYSPTQTNSAGLYGFQGLAPGNYRIQVATSSEVLFGGCTVGSVGVTARGTAGQGALQVQLGAGENGSGYNFGVLGVQQQLISLRLFLASTPPMYQVIQNMHAAPQVSLGGSGGSTPAATYATHSAATAIISSAATISSPDSTTLASMTVTIENLKDGSSEVLQADTSGTPIKSAYANGVLTLSGVADVSAYQTVLRSVKYSDAATSPSTTTRTISVVVDDGTNSSAVSVVSLAFVDGSAPSGYWIMSDQTAYNSTTDLTAGFTFGGAQVGATYKYTISSDGGGTPITASGTITSATQHVTGINIASLSDGNLTFSATLTNTYGNTGNAATTTATLDHTVPSGYSVTADQNALNSSTATSASVTITGAEIGTTYSCKISSNVGGTPITRSGTITSSTQQVIEIDISSLSDGGVIYYVTLTDKAGNVGTGVVATATLDRVAPSGYSITANQSTLDATSAKSAGFTFADAEVGTTFAYTISSSGGGTPVTNTGAISSATQNVTGIDLSLLSNGTLTYSVKLTDAAGNVGTATTASATLAQ